MMKYLAVDSDVALANYEACAWAKRGIGMERVHDMTDGIKKLLTGEYLFVGINDDAVDFMPLLLTMGSVTNIPILIVTSSFDTATEVAALGNGADLYARWHKTSEENVASVLAHIAKKTAKKTPVQKVLVHNNLLLSPLQRCVFIKNERIDLTPHEYGLLNYLMANHGIVLTYKQIYSRVWGCKYTESAAKVIRSTVARLRKKTSADAREHGLIENVWGVGFGLSEHSAQ